MAIKGGYKIIDLKGVDVTQSTMMIEGIYESIESNYGKPLLISGIVIDEVEKDDVFVQATLNGNAYEFEVYGYTIQVQDTDAVGVKTPTVPTILEKPTEEILINLKNGDSYLVKNIDTYTDTNNYIFEKINTKGLFVNSFNYQIGVPEELFSSYSVIPEGNFINSNFKLSSEGVYKNALISVVNDIVYITITYEL